MLSSVAPPSEVQQERQDTLQGTAICLPLGKKKSILAAGVQNLCCIHGSPLRKQSTCAGHFLKENILCKN